MRHARASLPLSFLLALTMTGCEKSARSGTAPKETTDVVVDQPTIAWVTNYEEFTGHTDAILSVEVRSRVTGYLVKKNVNDGQVVKKGDVLYEIDDRPYRAVYNGAVSSLASAEAHLRRIEADFKRASNLFKGANIGQQEFDLSSSNYGEAKAAVAVAKAALETAQFNVEFTKIVAPMDGQLSRILVDPGNLVRQETTILNDIVQNERLYVSFDINEEAMERVKELIKMGRVESVDNKKYLVEVGTSVDHDNHDNAIGQRRDLLNVFDKKPEKDRKPDQEMKAIEAIKIPDEFPYKGEVSFTENTLDAATGTLRVRGIIDNPPPYILTPGLFVRVHLPYGERYQASLVPDAAIGSDQGRNFVYVVDAEDEVVYRPVVTGLLFNGLRAIKEGLKADDRIIITADGIRRVRPGAKVVPKVNPMKFRTTTTPEE